MEETNEYRIFYFAQDGSFGDADALVLIRHEDLGEEGFAEMQAMIDGAGTNPHRWAQEALHKYCPQKFDTLVLDSAKVVISEQADKDMDAILDGTVERLVEERRSRAAAAWQNIATQLKPKKKLW
jgi:hypothetical protein